MREKLLSLGILVFLTLGQPATAGLLNTEPIIRGQPNDGPRTLYFCMPFEAPPSGTVVVVYHNVKRDLDTYRLDVTEASSPVDTCLAYGACCVAYGCTLTSKTLCEQSGGDFLSLPTCDPYPCDRQCQIEGPPQPLLEGGSVVFTKSGLVPGRSYNARLTACTTQAFCDFRVDISVYVESCD